MADNFSGKITLGGTIIIETVEQREAVEYALSMFASYCSPEFGESYYGSMNIEEVSDHIDNDGFLVGKDDQARYGEFEEVENACREAGIGYSRHSSARYEYDSEVVEWRPGMEGPHPCFSNDAGNLYLTEETARQILAVLSNAQKISNDRISEAKEIIKNELGDDIPKLEPLKIIDNTPPSEDDIP